MVKLLGIKILGCQGFLPDLTSDSAQPPFPSPTNTWQTNNSTEWQWNDFTNIEKNN